MPSSPQSRSFELIAGHPSLDLVNTLDWRFRDNGAEELLAGYDDLLSFAAQSSILSQKQIRHIVRTANGSAAAQAIVACRELREAAAEIFYAVVDDRTPPTSQIKIVEKFFKEAREHQQLVWSGSRVAWEWPSSDYGPDLPLWILSVSTARLMLSEDMRLLRACEKPDCRWLFLDTSKNHTRRWCDMKICGNRMKARRFKAQHKP
jgi:predicted RNA-binding Zn ribbon-like protein